MKKAVVLFAGGGGVDLGLQSSGIFPVIAVECEPDGKGGITKLSSEIAKIYAKNFPQTKLYKMPVEQWVVRYLEEVPDDIYCIHASPVCSNFSGLAKLNQSTESLRDFEQAIAICEAIKKIQPQVFTLEQVRGYQKFWGFHNIISTLENNNYAVSWRIINCADYGVPQERIRLFLIATKQHFLFDWDDLKQARISWYSAIKDLIPFLPQSSLSPRQLQALKDHIGNYSFALQRTGYIGQPKIRKYDRPFWTIRKMIATDHKLSNRTKFADIYCHQSRSFKALDINCLKRLATFPDYYKTGEVAITGAIFGYAVPPKLINIFYSFLAKR